MRLLQASGRCTRCWSSSRRRWAGTSWAATTPTSSPAPRPPPARSAPLTKRPVTRHEHSICAACLLTITMNQLDSVQHDCSLVESLLVVAAGGRHYVCSLAHFTAGSTGLLHCVWHCARHYAWALITAAACAQGQRSGCGGGDRPRGAGGPGRGGRARALRRAPAAAAVHRVPRGEPFCAASPVQDYTHQSVGCKERLIQQQLPESAWVCWLCILQRPVMFPCPLSLRCLPLHLSQCIAGSDQSMRSRHVGCSKPFSCSHVCAEFCGHGGSQGSAAEAEGSRAQGGQGQEGQGVLQVLSLNAAWSSLCQDLAWHPHIDACSVCLVLSCMLASCLYSSVRRHRSFKGVDEQSSLCNCELCIYALASCSALLPQATYKLCLYAAWVAC